jgi:hypothetical protein
MEDPALLALPYHAAVSLYRDRRNRTSQKAKLLVRYIISESKGRWGNANSTAKIVADERGSSIMQTETEILNSMDLARGSHRGRSSTTIGESGRRK